MRLSRNASIFFLLLALPVALVAQNRSRSLTSPGEEFFIISSLDEKKQQVVLKRPTEVTELMTVSEKTIFLDEQGRHLRFTDLRAGDTVWVTASARGQATRVITRIRRGPMTVEELHRRYLDNR